MTRPRFEALRVEHHGYPVAIIFDHFEGKQYMVYRRGSRYLHWNRRDLRVENQALRRVAREALDGAGAET